MKHRAILLFVLAGLASPMTLAQYEGYSASRLLVELGENLSEARNAEAGIKASVAARNESTRELQEINRDTERYQQESRRYQDDLALHNGKVDTFNGECGSGSFDQESLDRCESLEADLLSAEAALDARHAALEEQRTALRNRMEEYNSRERERASDAEAHLSHYDEITASIDNMLTELQNKEAFRDSPCFNRPSPDAKHQCLLQAFERR